MGSAGSDEDDGGGDENDPTVSEDDVARIARRCASSSCWCCTSKAGFVFHATKSGDRYVRGGGRVGKGRRGGGIGLG